MAKSCNEGSGNIPPEKNINMKNGKQPMVIRSKIVRMEAATIRLRAIIDTLVKNPTTANADNEPEDLYPRTTAVR